MNIVGCTTGVHMYNNVTGLFSEFCHGYDSTIQDCTTGIAFDVNNGIDSFNDSSLNNIVISGCTTSIAVNASANMIRTSWRNVTCFVGANCTGLTIASGVDIESASWYVNFEGGSTTGSVGVSFNGTLSGDSSKADLHFTQVAGLLGTAYQNPGNAVIRFREGDNMMEATSSGTVVATGPVVCNSVSASTVGTVVAKTQVLTRRARRSALCLSIRPLRDIEDRMR